MGPTYVALLGEVDEDASVLPTEEILDRLRPALERLNVEHAGSLVAPLVITGAFPEFSAILSSPAPLYRIARDLAEVCRPLPVHLGAARGGLTGGLDMLDAESVEGPAVDQAGELLYRARKEDRMLLLASGNEAFDSLFNALALMLHRTFRGWTDRQWEAVSLYRRLGRQTEVAGRLGVSQQSVSNTLAGAGWKTVAEVEDVLEKVLAGGR